MNSRGQIRQNKHARVIVQQQPNKGNMALAPTRHHSATITGNYALPPSFMASGLLGLVKSPLSCLHMLCSRSTARESTTATTPISRPIMNLEKERDSHGEQRRNWMEAMAGGDVERVKSCASDGDFVRSDVPAARKQK